MSTHRSKRQRVSLPNSSGKEASEGDGNSDSDCTASAAIAAVTTSALRDMADNDVSGWVTHMRARIASEMKDNDGIAIIDGFLPRAVAEELRQFVLSLEPEDWALNEDDDDDDDIPHTFLSCADNISEVNRILCSIMPEKIPSFSASRYMNGHGIERHNDALQISDGMGGTLTRSTALVLYLVDDYWSERDGGMFLDYGVCSDAGSTPKRTILPSFNRLVMFDVPRDHEVTPVTVDNDVKRPRLSIFGWFLAPDQTSSEDIDKLAASMSKGTT